MRIEIAVWVWPFGAFRLKIDSESVSVRLGLTVREKRVRYEICKKVRFEICKIKNIKLKKIKIIFGRVAGYSGWKIPTSNPTDHRLDGLNFVRVFQVVFSSIFSVFYWAG